MDDEARRALEMSEDELNARFDAGSRRPKLATKAHAIAIDTDLSSVVIVGSRAQQEERSYALGSGRDLTV